MRSGAFKLNRLSPSPWNLWQVEQFVLMRDSASCASDAKRKVGQIKGTKTLKAKASSINGRLGARSKKQIIVKTSTVENKSEILILGVGLNFPANDLFLGCEEAPPLRTAAEVFYPKEAGFNLLI